MAEKIAGLSTLAEVAEALGESVTNEASMSLAPMSARGVDPALAGAVAAAEDAVLTGPVAGSFATYVFVVNSREVGSFYTEDDSEMYAQRAAQYGAQMILPTMSANGVVKDNRARFF